MSEFAPTIAQPITNGAPTQPMGAENFSSFSSRGIFKDIRSNSSEGIIDINNGMDKDSEFQRSESFETQVQDSQSLFDISNPHQEQGIGNFDQPAQSTETNTTKQEDEGAVTHSDKNKEFTDMLSNSTVLWESPTSKLKGYRTQETPAQSTEKPTLLKENAEQTIETASDASTQLEASEATTKVEQQNSISQNTLTASTAQPENISALATEDQTQAEASVQPKTEVSSEQATNIASVTHVEATPTDSPQLQPEVRTQIETTTTALEAVREEVRLMPDTKEVTVTLTQPLPELQKQAKTQVMDKDALEKMLATEKVQKTKVQTEKELDTKATPTMKGKEVAGLEEEDEDETTITITKAWFEQDVAANQNRKIEIIKAYALVHYKWLRQYIGSVEGSEVADVIKKHRDREKLESMSIKAIEKDGSVDPFATTIERAQEIDSPEELDDLLEEAEEQFSATNFTSRPTKEIVDGEQIDYVHNGQEIFQANLDGEEVKVIMNGARSVKKPEFIKVEME